MAYFDHQIARSDASESTTTTPTAAATTADPSPPSSSTSAVRDSRERQGWMHCYCFKQLTKDPASLFDIDFSDVRKDDDSKYCQQWFISYTKAMTLKYGSPLIIILINMLVPMIFAQFS
jgi:hypothetical protein